MIINLGDTIEDKRGRQGVITNIGIAKAKIKDWAIYIEATLTFFSPIELPIKAFVAAPNPTPTAIIVK